MECKTKRDKIVEFAAGQGIVTKSELHSLGASRSYIEDLARRGVLDALGRGLYSLPDFPFTENHSLVEITKWQPKAVICLSSSLLFHGIGTQLPPFPWIALPQHSHEPRVPTVGVRVVRMNDASLSAGVEIHRCEGVDVRVFSIGKTIADCFKFRRSIGTEATLEALREVLRDRRCTRAEIIDYAHINKVWNVMRPYLEALSW